MHALDRAKRVQSALTKLVERRERICQRAQADFRLDLLAAIEAVDDETLALVQRGLCLDDCEQGLQYALQLALDERNERRRRGSVDALAETRRSGEVDPHEAETDLPPPLPPATFELEGDEDDLSGLDTPRPSPRVLDDDGRRYPEPGEAAVELPDGSIVAAVP